MPLKLLLTCHACKITDAPFFVRERGKHEDVTHWMEEVRYEAAVSHSLRSPQCREQKCDLKIPCKSEQGVGFEK